MICPCLSPVRPIYERQIFLRPNNHKIAGSVRRRSTQTTCAPPENLHRGSSTRDEPLTAVVAARRQRRLELFCFTRDKLKLSSRFLRSRITKLPFLRCLVFEQPQRLIKRWGKRRVFPSLDPTNTHCSWSQLEGEGG